MLGGQKFASDNEVQSVVRQWLGSAASNVLCKRHSQACWQIEQMFERTRTICL